MTYGLFKVGIHENKLIGYFHDIDVVYSFVSSRADKQNLFLTFFND